MTNSGWKRRWTRVAAAGFMGLAVAATAGTNARAEDDDNEAFDTKIIRRMLEGLGLRRDGAGIDYRERSPLVVPPGRELPPPETGSGADKVAAWPNDPDVKRARDLRAARKKPVRTVEEESVPELPSQLGPRHRTAPAHQVPTAAPQKDPTAPSTWQELNSKSIFTLGGLFGSPKEEYATFTGEPTRGSLIEPPAGYRTPSPTHAYGVGRSRARTEALNPMDHAGSNTGVPR